MDRGQLALMAYVTREDGSMEWDRPESKGQKAAAAFFTLCEPGDRVRFSYQHEERTRKGGRVFEYSTAVGEFEEVRWGWCVVVKTQQGTVEIDMRLVQPESLTHERHPSPRDTGRDPDARPRGAGPLGIGHP